MVTTPQVTIVSYVMWAFMVIPLYSAVLVGFCCLKFQVKFMFIFHSELLATDSLTMNIGFSDCRNENLIGIIHYVTSQNEINYQVKI